MVIYTRDGNLPPWYICRKLEVRLQKIVGEEGNRNKDLWT